MSIIIEYVMGTLVPVAICWELIQCAFGFSFSHQSLSNPVNVYVVVASNATIPFEKL